jgi:hypothetical protein
MPIIMCKQCSMLYNITRFSHADQRPRHCYYCNEAKNTTRLSLHDQNYREAVQIMSPMLYGWSQQGRLAVRMGHKN